MDLFAILALVGGLALFLYGMTLMSSSLEKVSGNRLEHILGRITNNKFKAAGLGMTITAIIQSSSATTVMLVGFVSAGIMQLSQAIGVIMGANVGTTVTAWVLSLTGIESDNLILTLLKPDSFCPVLALIGVVMVMMSKKGKKKDIGAILLGFAILMTGMSMMSDAVKPLSSDPGFTKLLTMFSNPLFGILAGAIFTAIIQSSSASVGVLQVLSATGALTFGSAIPIIMGQNIGTCATALISCIGANKNAKRVAFVHLYFNVIGTIIFLALYYTANGIFDFAFADSQITAFQIAIVHTIFNVVTTLILLPFTKQLEKLAILTVRDKANEEEIVPILDERLLGTPSVAVEQVKKQAARMAALSRNALLLSLKCMDKYDPELDAEIVQKESEIDRFEDAIGSYLVKLSSCDLTDRDSRAVSMLLHVIGDFERISDHAVNIMEVSKEMYEKDISFSEDAIAEIKVITSALEEILSIAMRSYVTEDAEMAKHVEPIEQVIDVLKEELRAKHIERLRKGNCTIELGFIFSDLLTNYGRVSDHCSNIAVALIEIQQFGSFDTHQ
ncbi:MAG: Na/Pi cotransporter family protein, partial [Oscillospiraceae bacterium]|nr:Na/Pi cotransporter family protein [Oscillospiraceae bacterium]